MYGAHFFINIIFDIHTYVLFMLMYVKTRTHTNTQFSFNVAVKLLPPALKNCEEILRLDRAHTIMCLETRV